MIVGATPSAKIRLEVRQAEALFSNQRMLIRRPIRARRPRRVESEIKTSRRDTKPAIRANRFAANGGSWEKVLPGGDGCRWKVRRVSDPLTKFVC